MIQSYRKKYIEAKNELTKYQLNEMNDKEKEVSIIKDQIDQFRKETQQIEKIVSTSSYNSDHQNKQDEPEI